MRASPARATEFGPPAAALSDGWATNKGFYLGNNGRRGPRMAVA